MTKGDSADVVMVVGARFEPSVVSQIIEVNRSDLLNHYALTYGDRGLYASAFPYKLNQITSTNRQTDRQKVKKDLFRCSSVFNVKIRNNFSFLNNVKKHVSYYLYR